MSLERGQIYFVNLNPVQGKEQSGARPVLILSVECQRDRVVHLTRSPKIFIFNYIVATVDRL